jgi:hypothetical protein
LKKHEPEPRVYPEKIGDTQYLLEEITLDAFDEIALWDENPRLQAVIDPDQRYDEDALEAALRRTPGYDALKKSIQSIGQAEPIYAWRKDPHDKYLVLEGATRVTIKRELARARQGQPDEQTFRRVSAKKLPPEFSETERIILLARIHVRGPLVRSWGRYIEAKFIYDTVTPLNGRKASLSIAELARHMQRSQSWVSRLKDAYEFAEKYVEYRDDPDAAEHAKAHFSILEEISKVTGFGPRVKDYGSVAATALRNQVFEMVKNDVFQEYRDARFMKEFFDDPEKWEQLSTMQKGIGHQLAAQVKAGGSSLKARIAALAGQVEKALDRDPEALGENESAELLRAAGLIESKLTDMNPFRLRLRSFAKSLEQTSVGDLTSVTAEELEQVETAVTLIRGLQTQRAAKAS